MASGTKLLFMENEFNDMDGFFKGLNYVQVTCGCTSRRYGDALGILKVHANGQFLIRCECAHGCKKERLTPYEFEKHCRKEGTSNWPSHIWVLVNDKKVSLGRTKLLKYYKHATNGASGSMRRIFHRDEFIRCCKCKRERRFRLRTKKDCRIYHDAAAKKNWKCTDMPYNRTSCEDEEERTSRKSRRGCPRSSTCVGCTSCVCFGCLKCRFVDCSCRSCVDFMQNAEP